MIDKIKDEIDKKTFAFVETGKCGMKKAIYISDLYRILEEQLKHKENGIAIEVDGEKLVLENAVLTRFAELEPVHDYLNDLEVKKPTGKIITVLTHGVSDNIRSSINQMIESYYQ